MSTYGEELYGSGTWGGSGVAPGPGGGAGEEEESAPDDTWTVMAGAIIDTVAYGPTHFTDPDNGLPIDAPGVYVEPLSMELISRTAMSTVIATLPDSFSRSFQDEANNTGSGSFALVNTDDDFSDLALDRMVTFKVYGNKALTMIIESMHKVAAAEGEEYDQITVATGRGHLALWEQFILYPSRGPDSVPVEEDRVFNWTSPAYDSSGWKYAIQIARQGGWTPAWEWFGTYRPDEWPDPTSYWIWGSPGTPTWAKPGVCYFRKGFTVPSGVTQIAIFYALDNGGKIYVDGIPYAEQSGTTGGGWTTTKSVTVDVTPGPHLIAVECVNLPMPSSALLPPPPSPVSYTVVAGDTLWGIAQRFYGNGLRWRIIYDKNSAQIQADAEAADLWDPYDPGHWIFPGQVFTIPGIEQPSSGYKNPGAFVLAAYVQEEDEEPTTLLFHSDNSWRVASYPEEPPGMTPGQVIRLAKKEASRRGNDLVDLINLKFSDKNDSAGASWEQFADIASKVGTDYLTFLLELTAKYVDIWMAPGTLDLYAWKKGTRSQVKAVTLHHPTDGDDPDSGNMYELSHTILT